MAILLPKIYKNFEVYEFLDSSIDDPGSSSDIEIGCRTSQVAEPEKVKTIKLWTDGETRLLLDKYATYLPQIGPMKVFRNKREMWQKIGEEVGREWKQVEQRFKTVLRRKKIQITNNKTSGAVRLAVDFDNELERIAQQDDSIEPAFQISSQHVTRKESVEPISSAKRKRKTSAESMLEFLKEKEEAKERRHREKMEKADVLQNLLLQLIKSENRIS